MEIESKIITSSIADGVQVRAFSGHFATNHSHVNRYIDLTDVKVRHKMAKRVAAELAGKYCSAFIDTIICLEGTEMIGAFMADELSLQSVMEMNDNVNICVITPGVSTERQFIFLDNTKKIVQGRNILLLVSWITTGRTIERVIESLDYYGGHLAGICALFSIVDEIQGCPVNAAFTIEDVPNYLSYSPGHCELCSENKKIDAIINSYGYLKI